MWSTGMTGAGVAVASCGGGAPAREEGQGQAGELHGAMRKLARELIGVGEGRSRGFRRPPAAMGMDEAWPWSFTAERRSCSGVQFGPRGTGGRGSTVSSSGGGNGGAAARSGTGAAWLGLGSEGELSVRVERPWAKQGGGRARQGGEGVEEGQRRRARGLAVACSPGGLDGQLNGAEGRLGHRSVVATAAGMALKAGRGRAPWSVRLSRRRRRGAP